MTVKKFYGTEDKKAVSYLEFGSINLVEGSKEIWDFRVHEKAYDFLMHARYSHDLYSYLIMADKMDQGAITEAFEIYNTEVHHADDASVNLSKLLALINQKAIYPGEDISFFEIGQTLFGCIEGILVYQKFLKQLGVHLTSLDLKEVKWMGVDISDFFNRISKVMHFDYSIVTSSDLADIKDQCSVFFAKGVTLLYACENIDEFYNMINRGKFGVFDYSFSLDGEQEVVLGTGKLVKYLDYNAFDKRYKNSDKKILVRKSSSKYDKSTKRVWVDCIYGEPDVCENYVQLDTDIRGQVNKEKSSLASSEKFLTNIAPSEWVPIEQFINQIIN